LEHAIQSVDKLQAFSQQKELTQKPLAQSPFAKQSAPFPFFATQLEPEQEYPAAQPFGLQVELHPVVAALQRYPLGHGCAEPPEPHPPPPQVSPGVSIPFSHEAALPQLAPMATGY
jgi:hypothetical protein